MVRYEGTVVRYGGTVQRYGPKVRWSGGTVVRFYGGTVLWCNGIHDATIIWYDIRWNGRVMMQYKMYTIYSTARNHKNIEQNNN